MVTSFSFGFAISKGLGAKNNLFLLWFAGFGISLLRAYVLVSISFPFLWFLLLPPPPSSLSPPFPSPHNPVLFEDFWKEKWNLNTFILICWNAIEDKEGLGLCLMNCQPMLNIVLLVDWVAWDFSVLWPWTWRGYQNSFCSITINCTLGTVLHLYYGSVWSNFSPKSASQRNFLRFCWKQADRPRSDEDVLGFTSLWTVSVVVLCSFCLFFLMSSGIDACPVVLFSRRMCFSRCLLWPLARLSNQDIEKPTESPLGIVRWATCNM